ncbi:MAG: ThiF family adenylyltransferase [Desulfarculaceae bacterium]|jgi:hypothetical protein
MPQPDFSHRTRALFGQEGLHALEQPLVAIAGLGGVGGAAFMNLVRAGVRRFRLAENGIFDPPDMNRQFGALSQTMDRPKLDIYAEWAMGINSGVELELFPEGTTLDNLERFLTGVDIHIGATDVDKGKRMKDKGDAICQREGIPLFTAGALGMGCVMINHRPGGMTPAQFWPLMAAKKKGGALLPAFLTEQFSPPLVRRMEQSVQSGKLATCSIGASLSGTFLAGEIMVHILRKTGLVEREAIFAPRFVVFDQALASFKILDVTAD